MTATTTTAVSDSASLRTAVATRLTAISPAVESEVIDTLVAREVARRKDMIVKGLDQLDSVTREFHKVNKPDIQNFNADGTVATSAYSKERLEEIKKAQEKLDKLTKALDKAIAKGDIGDLSNLVK